MQLALVAWSRSTAAGQAAPPLEVTDELLMLIAAESAPAVRQALGVKLAGIRVRLGTVAEIEDALAAENAAIFEHLAGGPEAAAEQARLVARSLAPALLAKYVFARHEILVQGPAFGSLAELLDLPELASEAALRAVVLHELVHAADDERFDLMQLLTRCATTDAVRAATAVIEGHAQLVARELAARLGCAEGFATATRAITSPPAPREGAGEGERFLRRMMASYFAFSYVEGEAFLAALRREGGADALQRAFREPPADALVVTNPAWFLHPEQRPRLEFDLEPALAAFAADFAEGEWLRQRLSLSAADMRTVLSPLPPEEIDALAAKIRQNMVQVLSSTAVPGRSQVAVGVFEFGSAEDASAYLASYRRLQPARDQLMKEGAIRVLRSEYEELGPPGPAGLLVEKRMLINFLQVESAGVCIARGPLAVEGLAANAANWDVQRLLETALEVLDEVEKHPRAAEAAAPR